MEEGSSIYSIFLILALAFFALLYFFFSAVSLALIRSRNSKLRSMLEEKEIFGAQAAKKILFRPNRALLGCRIYTFISVFGLAVVFAELWRWLWPATTELTWDIRLIAGALAVVFVLTCILVPYLLRAWVYDAPEKALCVLSYPLWFFLKIISPLTILMFATSRFILAKFKLGFPREKDFTMSSEELSEIVERSAQAGKIEEDEGEMIQGIVEIGETFIREVMTPRQDVVAVSISDPINKAIELYRSEGLSRLLVYGDNLDDIKGILIAKDLMPLVGKELNGSLLEDFVREVLIVSGGETVDGLLARLKTTATHFAVVMDEHGGGRWYCHLRRFTRRSCWRDF